MVAAARAHDDIDDTAISETDKKRRFDKHAARKGCSGETELCRPRIMAASTHGHFIVGRSAGWTLQRKGRVPARPATAQFNNYGRKQLQDLRYVQGDSGGFGLAVSHPSDEVQARARPMSAYMKKEMDSLVYRADRAGFIVDPHTEPQTWLSPGTQQPRPQNAAGAGRSLTRPSPSPNGRLNRSSALTTPNWFGAVGDIYHPVLDEKHGYEHQDWSAISSGVLLDRSGLGGRDAAPTMAAGSKSVGLAVGATKSYSDETSSAEITGYGYPKPMAGHELAGHKSTEVSSLPVAPTNAHSFKNVTAHKRLRSIECAALENQIFPQGHTMDTSAMSPRSRTLFAQSQSRVEEIFSPVRTSEQRGATSIAQPRYSGALPSHCNTGVMTAPSMHYDANDFGTTRPAFSPAVRIGTNVASYVTGYSANYAANFGESRKVQSPLQIKIGDRHSPTHHRGFLVNIGGVTTKANNIDARTF